MYPGEIPVVTDDFRRGCWPLCLFAIALLRFCLLLGHRLLSCPCECPLSMGNIGGEGSLGYWICKIRMVHVPGEDDDDVYVHNFVTEGELDFHLE